MNVLITEFYLFHVLCINQTYKFFLNRLGYMNVLLLHSNLWHVSTIHVAIYRAVRTRIQVHCNASKSINS